MAHHNKGAVNRLNDVFKEIGLEPIPEGGSVTRLDAISMLEEAGDALQMQIPRTPTEISEICGKACYKSQQEARAVIKKRKTKGSGPLREYHCPDCGFYHITSSISR